MTDIIYVGLSFSAALNFIKSGRQMRRTGWSKDIFIFLVQGSTFKVNRLPLLGIYPEGTEVNYSPHIDIQLEEGKIMVWTPTQDDLMANDWKTL